ncbi:MAG: hypothetical protein PHS61_05370, partial [Candidatus Omnitrophica bacterium]|nr:hypothetical protein [Candidatus Omnitrophota bacterium]
MMRRRTARRLQVVLAAVFILAAGLRARPAFAVSSVPDLPPGYTFRGSARSINYYVSLVKLEVSKDNGATVVTVFDATREFDISSVSAGQTVGSWFSGIQLEAGTYNWIRRTTLMTFRMKGYVAAGATTYYTSSLSVDGTNVNHSSTFDPGSPPADYAEISVKVGGPSGETE